MRLKDYSFIIIALLMSCSAIAQFQISGKVTDAVTGVAINDVDIYDKDAGVLATTDASGNYRFETQKTTLTLVFFTYEYDVLETNLSISSDAVHNFKLKELSEQLTAIEITARKEKIFQIERLKDVEGTAIYAGKRQKLFL